MVHIELTIKLNCNKQRAYEVLKNIADFPKFMRDVKKLEILEDAPNKLVTAWEVDVDGATVIWKEEDIYDDEALCMKFRMIEGDYQSYTGEWKIKDTSAGTELSLTADFDWGIPVFEKFVGHILKRKACKSLKGMLNAIKKRYEENKQTARR